MEIPSLDTFLIPCDYWTGRNTLALPYPWLTPGSIDYLYRYCKPDMTVLEFGSGGSTLFFSMRTKSVLSIETQKDWYDDVNKNLLEYKAVNVDLYYKTTVTECVELIAGRKFDIILDDCVELSRLEISLLSLQVIKPGGIVIVDNYSADYCNGIEKIFENKKSLTYDDPHWAGSGTKIYFC